MQPEDLEGEPDVPYRNVYFGAAGVAWALDRLARDGVGPVFAGACTTWRGGCTMISCARPS